MKCSGLRIGGKLMGTVALTIFLSVCVRADDSAALYKAKCVSCHGTDGKGDSPMAKKIGVRDFGSPAVLKETDQEFVDIIAKGKNNMPGYASSLKEPQIKDLAAYARGLSKK